MAEAARREECYGAPARRSVSQCFDRGLVRARSPELAIRGEGRTDPASGLAARFSIEVGDGTVRRVGFRASTCVTLVAYCEALAERATGLRLDEAARLGAAQLIDLLPGVPPLRRDRAALAVAAFRAALAAAPFPPPTTTGEER